MILYGVANEQSRLVGRFDLTTIMNLQVLPTPVARQGIQIRITPRMPVNSSTQTILETALCCTPTRWTILKRRKSVSRVLFQFQEKKNPGYFIIPCVNLEIKSGIGGSGLRDIVFGRPGSHHPINKILNYIKDRCPERSSTHLTQLKGSHHPPPAFNTLLCLSLSH